MISIVRADLTVCGCCSCGAVLSLCPFGSLLSGAAGVAARALNKADEMHRSAIATHIAESMTLAEFNQVSWVRAKLCSTLKNTTITRCRAMWRLR